jgi:hypothetical protein
VAEFIAHDFELKVESDHGGAANYQIVGEVRSPNPGYSFDVMPYPEGTPPSDEKSAFELLTNEPTGPSTDPISEVRIDHPFTDSNKLRTVTLYLRGDVRTEEGHEEIELHVLM